MKRMNNETNVNPNAETDAAKLGQPNSTDASTDASANNNTDASANAKEAKQAKKSGKKGGKKGGKKPAENAENAAKDAENGMIDAKELERIRVSHNVIDRLRELTGNRTASNDVSPDLIVSTTDIFGNATKVNIFTKEIYDAIRNAKTGIENGFAAYAYSFGVIKATNGYKNMKNPAKDGENYNSLKDYLTDAAKVLGVGYETLSQYANVGELFYMPLALDTNDETSVYYPFKNLSPSILSCLLPLRNSKKADGEKIDLLDYLIQSGFFRDNSINWTQKALKSAVAQIKDIVKQIPNAETLLIEGKTAEQIRADYDAKQEAERAAKEAENAPNETGIELGQPNSTDETPKDETPKDETPKDETDETPKDETDETPKDETDETPKDETPQINPYKLNLNDERQTFFTIQVTSYQMPDNFKIPSDGVLTGNIIDNINPSFVWYFLSENRFAAFNRDNNASFAGLIEYPENGKLNGIDLNRYVTGTAQNWKLTETNRIMKDGNTDLAAKIYLLNACNELDDITAYELSVIQAYNTDAE